MENVDSKGENNSDPCAKNPRKKFKRCLNSARRINWEEYNSETERETSGRRECRSEEENNDKDGDDDNDNDVESRCQKSRCSFNVFLEEAETHPINSGTENKISIRKNDFEQNRVGTDAVFRLSKFNEGEGSLHGGSQTIGETEKKSVAEQNEIYCGNSVKYSECRGETPEMNESNKNFECEVSDGSAESDGDTNFENSNESEEKKTPDRSLFKKFHEQLLYECNLTPKKMKKKLCRMNL